MPDDQFSVSIIDEAHALIDPTLPSARGVPPSGWTMHAGAQAWHIMRSSRLSIFLLDDEQGYRDNETTTQARIIHWAADHDIKDTRQVSLGKAQFRCSGSKEYVDWLDNLLGLTEKITSPAEWRHTKANPTGPFHFEIVENPQQMEDSLRERVDNGDTARLLASYGRKWITKHAPLPHILPATDMDFCIYYQDGAHKELWAKPWNFAPKQDYTLFVQAPPGSPMHDDPLCEVGCPYVVRGFDYDWVGLLWLKDLVWRNGEWKVNLSEVYETAWNKSLAAARRENRLALRGPKTEALLDRLTRGYRILLSRAVRGVYIWFEDEETRHYMESELHF